MFDIAPCVNPPLNKSINEVPLVSPPNISVSFSLKLASLKISSIFELAPTIPTLGRPNPSVIFLVSLVNMKDLPVLKGESIGVLPEPTPT